MSGKTEVRVLKEQITAHNKTKSSNNQSSGNGEYIDSQTTLKIALIGPCLGGKTKMANQIDGRPILLEKSLQQPQNENNPHEFYEPTAGVRILIFDENVNARSVDGTKNALLQVKVELWDCAGDDKYEGCKLSITDKLDGAIVIFDPTSKEQATEVRVWCEYFIRHGKLNNNQISIFANGELTQSHKPLSIKVDNRTVLAPIINVTTRQQPIIDEATGNREALPAKIEFQNFVGGVFGAVHADQLEAFAS